MAVREALSARLDGEESSLSEQLIAEHCETCFECDWWQNQAHILHRQIRIAPAPRVPDLTPAIMQRLDGTPLPATVRERALQTCRMLLGICAALQLIMTLPMLLGTTPFGAATAPVHLDHELGSWDLALSAGLLFAAIRPARAWGMLPLVGAVALSLGATGIIDVITGHTNVGAESSHLLEIIGVVFLWNIARLSKDQYPASRQTQVQLA